MSIALIFIVTFKLCPRFANFLTINGEIFSCLCTFFTNLFISSFWSALKFSLYYSTIDKTVWNQTTGILTSLCCSKPIIQSNRQFTTDIGRAYLLLTSAFKNRFTGPVYGIRVSFIMAMLACVAGIERLCRIEDKIVASLERSSGSLQRGKRIPLNQAAGFQKPFC